MILWQSLQVEAYRDDQGPASASGYVDQHERLPGTSSMICRGVPRRMRGPPMIIYPTPVGLVSRAAGRPRESGVAAAPAVSPGEAASTTGSGGVSGQASAVVMIIFVVRRQFRARRLWSTRRRPRRRHEGSGSFPVWSWSCRGLGRRGVHRELLQVVAGVEVRGESVPQILGGEIIQRCPGDGSCERSDIVSLIIDSLQQLRQRRPVALSEESLVEPAGQGYPPLLRPDRSRPGQPTFHFVDALQRLGSGPSRVAVPILDVDEKGLPHRVNRHLEAGADGVAALVPTSRWASGEDSRRLEPGLIGWQAGEPFVNEFVAERPRLVEHGSERLGAVEGQ
jgi:hypothetical protein